MSSRCFPRTSARPFSVAQIQRSRSIRCSVVTPVDDERAPICPVCGVTMVPAALSATDGQDGDWVCLECEETAEPD
jgi:tRNA(Ile2) C34 agmatinyltransferase TiaS